MTLTGLASGSPDISNTYTSKICFTEKKIIRLIDTTSIVLCEATTSLFCAKLNTAFLNWDNCELVIILMNCIVTLAVNFVRAFNKKSISITSKT